MTKPELLVKLERTTRTVLNKHGAKAIAQITLDQNYYLGAAEYSPLFESYDSIEVSLIAEIALSALPSSYFDLSVCWVGNS